VPVPPNDESHTADPVTVGGALPFFEVTTVADERVRYADLWQRRNVALVCLPRHLTSEHAEYAKELARRSAEFDGYAAVCVVTRDAVAGLPQPSVVIADRWGEVQYLASSDLPPVQDLLDTLDYVQRRCPECEGEWR
jgi:hypothetical protein